ncbi:ATPase subunit of ABC transporter with duplicated ATPase domains [Acholeplasma morum]|uniref:ABC-F family ATP-binding cassette domain-containing protein n=1 Tax=Paracholeplasma morum TaxID=264637 RepID=UPI001957E5E5|nr:ABC-F family ATP-binding cassette domain-containing protein [Paracholeplasma morum]MBM7453719.1 ATPase subunit of ABC transporter with duplicated ATPase domains [Paracholeplasma morum]
MSLLEVSNLSFRYDNNDLLIDANVRLFLGDHAVLVGPNGAGKTTLMNLLNKNLSPDKGSITWLPNIKVGYLDQYAKIDKNITVGDYLLTVFKPLFDKELEMETLYQSVGTLEDIQMERALNNAAAIGDMLIEKDFYAIKSKLGNIIHGLGLEMSILDSPIKQLSGGMRAKIILGKLLLDESDILLLDEPTNFLDIKHIDWLTKFLQNYPKAFLVVSHDEAFLRDIADTVIAVENKGLTRYKGNFEYYLSEREIRFQMSEKAFVAQQKFIQKQETFIAKNIVRASTTKQAQSVRTKLEKIEKLGKPVKQKELKFHFPFAKDTGRDVLTISDLEIGYTKALLKPIDYIIRKNEKVIITGKNGVGKSTLVKTVLGLIKPISGSFKWIDTANISYFEQEFTFNQERTASELCFEVLQDMDHKKVYSLLARFGISREMADRKLSSLSGGQKTKVRLALMSQRKSNVIILDEPTNHLDQIAKDALRKAIMEFPGVAIIVSHDKAFHDELGALELELKG